MKMIKRKYTVVLSTVITAIFLMIVMVVMGIEPFGDKTLVNYDCQSQIYPLLCTLHDKLINKESFLYGWEGGLGDGFLPTYFYYLSSPINFLVAFVNKKDIRSFINLTIFLRMTLSSTAMAAFFSNKIELNVIEDKKEISNKCSVFIIPLSCAYGLSGFVFGYYHESMWLDSYMIFPLVLMGYNIMIKQNKPLVYILCLVYSSLCSFYMTFMIGLFLVLWFLLDEYESFKLFLKKGILFSVSSLLAIGMTSFSIIVSFLGVMKTHVEDEPDIKHMWFGNIFNIIKYQFPMSTPINVSYDNNCANLYCGIFALMLLFVYIFSKNIKISVKIKRIMLILFVLISMNEAILNFIWHGFHYQLCIPNRFAFILIFLLLLTAYETLESAEDMKTIAIGLVIAEVFPILSYSFTDFDSQYGSKTVLIISIILILIYGMLFLFHAFTKKIMVIIAFSIIMISEIMVNAVGAISYDISQAGRYDQVLADTEKLISKVESEDNTPFYRSKLLGTILANTGNIVGVNSIQSFNSMANNNILRFAGLYGIYKTDVSIDENGGYEPLDDILGVRYLYSAAEVFPSKVGYELTQSSDIVEVYRNNNALSLGYAVNKSIKNHKADKKDIVANINNLTTSMTGCGNILNEVIPNYNVSGEGIRIEYGDVEYFYTRLIPDKKTDQEYVKVSFDVTKEGYYNMYMDYSDYGIITIYVNDDIRRFEYTSFGGVLNIGELHENDKVTVFIQSENKMADGYALVEYPILELRFLCINDNEYNKFINGLKADEMKIDAISGGNINASINVPEEKMLFTSIPYDDSWHIYENGKELKKEKLLDAFIGLDLDPGNHSLVFKYIPSGFYVGIIVTILSWLFFVIWIIYVKKIHLGVNDKHDDKF